MTPTDSQRRLLCALRDTEALTHPWAPTLADVASVAGLRSRSAVTYHLPALEAAGWVEVGPSRRGVRLTDSGRRLAKRSESGKT